MRYMSNFSLQVQSIAIAAIMVSATLIYIYTYPIPASAQLATLSDEELIAEFQSTVELLSGIGSVMDEAIVTDVAGYELTNLRNDINMLVEDGELKPNFLNIIDASRNTLGNVRFFIDMNDEQGASNMINATDNIIDAFISAVEAQRGNKISEQLADELIGRASAISDHLYTRDRALGGIIPSISLPITESLITRSDSKIQLVADIASELQSRGYVIDVRAEENSPVIVILEIINQAIIVASTAASAILVTNLVNRALVARGEPPLTSQEYAEIFVLNASIIGITLEVIDHFGRLRIARDAWFVFVGTLSVEEYVNGFLVPEIVQKLFENNPALLAWEVDMVLSLRQHFPLNSISGFKFNDLDGDGIYDNNEPLLSGWNITLSRNGEKVASTLTDAGGFFNFTNLAAGNYVVTEELQPEWINTTPLSIGPIEVSGNEDSVNNSFGNKVQAPEAIFSENFDSGITGWSLTLCQKGSGQTCELGTITNPTPVPSSPNWGFTQVRDTAPGCGSAVASGGTKTFTVPVTGDYKVSAAMFATPCDICTVVARILVDGQIILVKSNGQAPSVQSATIPLTAGTHSIQMRMNDNIACFGSFRAQFDNITIETASGVSTLSSPSLPGGPYYWIELNQTSVNATAPDAATVRLEVHWDAGYEPEPVLINVMSNSTYTGITNTVTSAYNTTTHQAFDITFDISPEVQVGQYQYFIFVNEEDGEDSLAEAVQLSIQ
jgi:SdrD B-like protein